MFTFTRDVILTTQSAAVPGVRERGQQRGGHTRRPRLRQVGGQGGTLEAGARSEDQEGGRQGEGQQPHGHNTILGPVLY